MTVNNRANYDKSMKLGENTEFDMRNKIKYSAIFRLGDLCPVLRIRYYGKSISVNYTAMKHSKPTQFDLLKMIKMVPTLRNTLCAIFRLGYLCPVLRIH